MRGLGPRLAACCAALALCLAAVSSAHATEKTMRELVEAYETHLVHRDSEAYAGQKAALEAIAVRRTEVARKELRRLWSRYGGADRRRDAVLLGAWVRYGEPSDLDLAIDWVEARKDPLLLDMIHLIVAEAGEERTKAHLRDGALRSATPRVKAQIVRALGIAREKRALPALFKLARETNLLVRIEALEALGRIRDRRALPVVQVFLRDENAHIRDAAARGLGLLGNPLARPALQRALTDAEPNVIESAAGALGRIGDHRAIPALIAALERTHKNDLRVADALTEALQALSGKAIHADPELWRAWWNVVKDRTPFKKEAERPGSKTVPGATYYGFPVRSSRCVFVLDVSRSMGWNQRLTSAQRELIQVLQNLPNTTKFNIIVYSDRAFSWKRELTLAKPATIKRAIGFVRAQKPLNGTNSYGALAAAFDMVGADTIFFLSDGHPSVGRVTDPDLILMQVRDWNRLRRVRVHGIALLRGQAPIAFRSVENPSRSLAFMKRLATDNNGRFKLIR